MQHRIVRLGLIVALLIAGLTLLPMVASAAKGLGAEPSNPVAQVVEPTNAPGATVPTATPTGTVPPLPTATATRTVWHKPHKPMWRKPMRMAPTATATPPTCVEPDTGSLFVKALFNPEVFKSLFDNIVAVAIAIITPLVTAIAAAWPSYKSANESGGAKKNGSTGTGKPRRQGIDVFAYSKPFGIFAGVFLVGFMLFYLFYILAISVNSRQTLLLVQTDPTPIIN